jgi:5-methylcytosine-specific restriction endonuclease McrA
MIIKILEEFDVKRCSKKENCKNPDGCLQSRDNFYNVSKMVDRKHHICSFCNRFDNSFRRADQNKQNCMLEFQKIKEKEEQDEFLVKLYKDGYTSHELGAISLRGIDNVIILLEKFDIKRCSQGEDCKNPDGCIQSRDNFYDDKKMVDRKHHICSFCNRFDNSFRRADQNKQNHMLEFQKIKEKEEQNEFLVNIYKEGTYNYQELSKISLRKIEDIINLLTKANIKRCGNPNSENPIQSRSNFHIHKKTIDGLSTSCKMCHQKYNKIYTTINSEEISIYNKKYNNRPGLYNAFASRLEFSEIDIIRRDPNNSELIQVQCKLCKEWFNPTNVQLNNRVNAINGKKESIGTECHLYCSEECKHNCPLYRTTVSELLARQSMQTNNLTKNDFKRMRKEIRKYFLKIKNPNRCELCGEELDQKDLILHHIVPVTINNMFEADIDNLIFICQKCHNLSHQKDGCTIRQLSQISIENKLC